MVGGIETAGVALALLPLLINQLDNYVQGLETLKTFRAKRYRRDIDRYRSNLGTQHAIFLNTLEQAADGVADYGSSDWIGNPDSDFWTNSDEQNKIERRFGRNYVPFTSTMNELSKLLEDLSGKLGFKDEKLGKDGADPSSLEREVKKFRHIFSKSIYMELFNRIDRANTILKTLVEQSLDLQERATKNYILKERLQRHKVARKLANSLHSAIIRGSCWRCQCKDQHLVCFVLDSSLTLGPDMSKCPPKFHMVFGLKPVDCHSAKKLSYGDEAMEPHPTEPEGDPSKVSSDWYEIEAESTLLQSPQTLCRTSQVVSNQGLSKGRGEPTIAAKAQEPSVVSLPPLADICSSLIGISQDQRRKLLGCVADDRHRLDIYRVRNIARRIQSETLYKRIATSSKFLRDLVNNNGNFVFSWKDRLKLAVNLACSVLQFHGSWLANQWRARDIMCPMNSSFRSSHPYVVWDVLGESERQDASKKTPSALIRNEAVFPLGLVLVELSLCENLETLRGQEDDDPVRAVMNLKTAARSLPAVEQQSGLGYRRVVERCLFWSDIGLREGTTLENAKMQDEVFQLIIAPLIDLLKTVEGQ